MVIAAQNYPQPPVTGDAIQGVEAAEQVPGAYVLHAGTALSRGALVSAGGRVLNVVGTGPDVATARATAYEAVSRITLRGMHYRSDIAAKAADATT